MQTGYPQLGGVDSAPQRPAFSDRCYVLGLDLGQAHDFTALAVLEAQVYVHSALADDFKLRYDWDIAPGWHPPPELDYWAAATVLSDTTWPWPSRPPLNVVHLERWRGVSYPEQVERIWALLRSPPFQMFGAALIVDQTGVGLPVTDLLREAGLKPVGISIHGGARVSRQRGGWSVPKRDLVSAVQRTLQERRLQIATSLPDAETLGKELEGFRIKLDPRTAHDSYSAWREEAHDDLLLAVALACWWRDKHWQQRDEARLLRKPHPGLLARIV